VRVLNLVSVLFKMSSATAILWVCLIASTMVCAQPKEIDSLERILVTSPADSITVDILTDLSHSYLPYKPIVAKQYADQAFQMAQEQKYNRGEVKALNCIAEYEYRQGNYARAIELFTQSLKLADQIRDSVGMAMANRGLGITYTFGFKQYDAALQYQLEALKIYERLKDKRNMAAFYGNITWIYAGLGKNLPEAHRLALLGIKISDSLGDRQLLSYNYNSRGLIFLKEGKYDSALFNLSKSSKIAEEVADRAVIAYNKSLIGQVYLKQYKYEEAITIFTDAAYECRVLHIQEILKDCYNGIAVAYQGLEDYKNAYHNHLHYIDLRDSLVNWETTQKALLIKLKYEGESRIAELELANEQEENELLIYEALIGMGTFFFIIVVLLAARNNRNKKEVNKILQEKNQEIAEQNLKLKEANNLKDKFFSIISHDLRSPLAGLKGLLSLLAGNEINDQEFKSFAPKINQRLMGVSETLENLLHWSQSQMKGMMYNPTDIQIKVVIDKCLLLFLETSAEKKLNFKNDISENICVYVDRNQAELIFRNLIHNAIKFTSSGGTISLISYPSNEFFQVCVSDTGIGMTQEQIDNLFRNGTGHTTHGTAGEKGTGLGLLLCKEMVENNGGKLSVTSEKDKGSTFHVFLKKSA